MEQQQLDAFKASLIARREDIRQLEASGREAASTVDLDQSKIGRLSRMDALQAQQMAQETARRRQLQLRKIDSALSRLEADNFGYCLKCGDEIALARLNFDPASTRCMGCMDDSELAS